MEQELNRQEESCRELKRHAAPVPGSDRISNLAPELIEHIFSCLPLRDSIRTSALSRSWRGRWPSAVRHLDFVETGTDLKEAVADSAGVYLDIVETRTVFEDQVDAVLDSLTGSIDSFKLAMKARGSSACLRRWMGYAVSHGAAALDVSMTSLFHIMPLPESVFSCRGLTSLCLSRLEVRIPDELPVYDRLSKLKLHSFRLVPDGDLGRLLASCPCLTDLEITDIAEGCEDLEISSPTLRSIYILSGHEFEKVSLKNCPSLQRAFVHVCLWSPCGIGDVLCGPFTRLEALDIMVMHVVPQDDPIPERLPHELRQLCSLRLKLNLRLKRDLVAAFCILRSSPALRDLTVSFIDPSQDSEDEKEQEAGMSVTALDFWEGGEWQTFSLKQLTSVRLDCRLPKPASSKDHLEFCKFLLASSPILQQFTLLIRCRLPKGEDVIQNDLTLFPKASEHVKIKVEIQELFD